MELSGGNTRRKNSPSAGSERLRGPAGRGMIRKRHDCGLPRKIRGTYSAKKAGTSVRAWIHK